MNSTEAMKVYAHGAVSAVIGGYAETLGEEIDVIVVIIPKEGAAHVASSLNEKDTYDYAKSLAEVIEELPNEHG